MGDDDDTQPQPMRSAADPIQRIYVGMSEMQRAYAYLAVALDAEDGEGIEHRASEFVAIALRVCSLVEVLPTPTGAAKREIAIAKLALWTAFRMVDELFAFALDRNSGPSDVVQRVRAEVAFALHCGEWSAGGENVS